MNFIQINDRYAIKSDRLNWIVAESGKSKNKDTGEIETVWISRWYFSTLRGAAKHLGNMMLRESSETSVTGLHKRLIDIVDELNGKLAVELKI